MKHRIFIILFFTFLFSCKDHHQKTKTATNTTKEIDSLSIEQNSILNVKFKSIDTTYISKNFKYKGKVKDVIKWIDKQGTHIVFTCESFYYSDFARDTVTINLDGEEKVLSQEFFNQNAEIFCYHYLLQNKKYKLQWKLYDKSLKCPMDAMAIFIDKSIEITDLNKNQTPEIWTMYRTACRGEISPSNLYLFMYEGSNKYMIEGESLNFEKNGGMISHKDNFNNEKVLLNFAIKKWQKNITDCFE